MDGEFFSPPGMPEAMCGLWGSSFCQLLGIFMESFIKAEQPKEGKFFFVGLFLVCDIKKSATLAGFYIRKI